jgi:hypothetical protein
MNGHGWQIPDIGAQTDVGLGSSLTAAGIAYGLRVSAHEGKEDRVDDLLEDMVGRGGKGHEDLVAQQVEGE